MVCRPGLIRRYSTWIMVAIIGALAPVALFASADDQEPPHRELTPEQALHKRILESLAGRRDSKGPETTGLKGPDLSEREKVIHVLNRLSFGPTPGEVDQVLKNGGIKAWLKEQMDPDHVDDATCDRVVAERFPWTKQTIQQLGSEFGGYENRNKVKQMREELPELVLTRAVLSKKQLFEVMCDFWRNHFCVDQAGGEEKDRDWADADYEKNVIRKYCFSKFGEMLYASARHPAMLEYLDNKLSKKNNWNENYAREVMELHTLGADRGYGNLDVQELSKVLTGWSYDGNYNFVFNAQWQQPGPKHWLGMNIPEGYNGGLEALRVLATHPNTAQFISEKLCRYLVNDNPPPKLVREVASVFRQSNGDLPKVYAAIFNSPEFFSRDNYRCKFKTPFQFTISAIRTTGAKLDSAADTCHTLRRMGEPIYDCPDPTGYRDQAESWMDAGVLTSRWQYAWDMVRGSVGGVQLGDAVLDRYKAEKVEDTEQKLILDLIAGEVGDRELAALKEAAPNNDIPRMVSILLGSPSFQQR